MKRLKVLFLGLIGFVLPLMTYAVTPNKNSNTAKTAHYYHTILNNPEAMQIFMRAIPKGGDLHTHLGGATYAENLIQYGLQSHDCLNTKNFQAVDEKHCEAQPTLQKITQDAMKYNETIDAWSMRQYQTGSKAAHDHFFDTFYKFGTIVGQHHGDALAEIAQRAADQHINYIELFTVMPDDGLRHLSASISFTTKFSVMREKLLAGGLDKIIARRKKQMAHYEAKKNKILRCGMQNEKSGCHTEFRYVDLALRDQNPVYVFAQLLAGFELAKHAPRIVAINLVQAEDAYRSLRDYHLHMEMVRYLHHLYPHVHITLHAGELNPNTVTPQAVHSHIRDAIEIADSQRIGHGVDVAYEKNATQLLKEMADKKIAVEINLTSNDKILGIKGKQHPLPLYLAHHVPVSLSTDDEGVLRTDLSREYARAALTYQLPYRKIKEIDRNSLTYSFLPGESLWQDAVNAVPVSACSHDHLGSEKISSSCQSFLTKNIKARMQWRLEKQFVLFEKRYALIK